jgi:threonine 3-dehydrogenase
VSVLKKRGILVIVGIYSQPVTVNLTRLVREHQQIRGSYRAPLATWPRVVDFLRQDANAARAMITHRVPLDRAIEGLELSRTKAASKVMIIQ